MAWTVKSYTSVGGRYVGPIPTNEYPESGGYSSWNEVASDYDDTFYSFIRQISRSDVDIYGYIGWNPIDDVTPADVFILKGQDGQNVTYCRCRYDCTNTNFIIQFDVASDLGGPWVNKAMYSGSILFEAGVVPWAACFERDLDGHTYVGMAVIGSNNNGARADYFGLMVNIDSLADNIGDIEGTEENPDYGEASGPGGYDGGTFDDSSDVIGVPTMPSIGVSSIGFVNVYNPSAGALSQLGEDLFPDFTPINPYSPTGDTVIDAITDVAEALANIAQNIPNVIAMYSNAQLINYIIDCHIIPVTPSVGAAQFIKIGYRTMGQSAPKVTSDYVDCDCGTLNIGEYYRNFIDYGPYTQAKLFLPFVGFVPIEPELFQSGELKVVYRFNVIDGSFMAFVLSTSSKSKLYQTVIGQWGGNACVHVPITGINYSNMVSGIAAGASAVVAEIGKGSLIGTADAALNTAAAAPALQSSNGYNATTSFLSVRTPYLVIERSVSHYAKDYGHEQGYPSEITADWSKLSGYTESDAIHLEGLGATEEEMKEIASLLAAGVIL